MVNHGTVKSTVKPSELVIDEFSVWVHTNIIEASENVGGEVVADIKQDKHTDKTNRYTPVTESS